MLESVSMFTSDYVGGLDRLNALVDNETHPGRSRRSIFSDWLKRPDGFERLEQSSDGENELENNAV